MQSKISILITFALTMSAAAVSAAPSSPEKLSEPRSFKDWTLTCDNGRRCVAINDGDELSESGAIVLLQREAGPDGQALLEVLAHKPIDVEKSRFDGQAFATKTADWERLRDQETDFYSYRWITRTPSAIASWLDAARNAKRWTLGSSGAPADQSSASLSGLSATLLAMDELQGRIQTITAWQRKGGKPAADVPAAPALPVVRPIGGHVPALGEVEARRLIAIAQKKFAADLRDCVSDEERNADAGIDRASDDRATSLSADKALVGLGCHAMGAYNMSSLWYLVDRHPPYSAIPLNFGEEASDGIDGSFKPNQLTNAGYANDRGELESFVKARGAGDCGQMATWIFDGSDFQLSGVRAQGQCVGIGWDDWPWLYRVNPVK